MLLNVRPQTEIEAHRNRSTIRTEKTVSPLTTKLPVISETITKMAKIEQALDVTVSCTMPTNISNVSISVEYE